MTAVAEQLGGWRRREFRRLLGLSVGLHIGGILLLGFTPTTRWRPAPGEVIAVEVVASAPRAAAPAPSRPAPAPAPAPAPKPAAAPKPVPEAPPAPPPPPVKKQVVLPKEPTTPQKKPEPKPRPEPRPQRRELDPSELQQKPPPAQEYDDVMAQLRAEAGEPKQAPAPAPAPTPEPVEVASAATPSAGSGSPMDPELAGWMRRVKVHVRRSWVVPPGFRMQRLETHVKVQLDSSGTVLREPEIVQRSGNPWYDEGVVRGIQKASPLPPPPEAGEWDFIFRPEDSY